MPLVSKAEVPPGAMTHPADAIDEALVDALRRRNAELSEAITARDNFLAIAAHELRNPMTPIVGQVQRLHRLVKGHACTLEDVEFGLRRIEWLIELYIKRATTLLDVSRITTGKLRLEPRPFDAAVLVREIVSAHEPAAQYAKSSLNMRAPETADVVSDRLALEQILDNLILNAIKYGAGKAIDVALDAGADVFQITIRDEGIGISADAQARIFERFERAVATGNQAGFGVGLWVVRQLVDAMGGFITVDSIPDKGTTFVVTLPRELAQEP
jgi:two-component system OmpR family sensor kinase